MAVQIFFKKEHAGYIEGILRGSVRTEPGTRHFREARMKMREKEIVFSPKQLTKGILCASIESGHLEKFRKLGLAVGEIEKRVDRDTGQERSMVHIKGHWAHPKIFMSTYSGREVKALGKRTIDEKTAGALRVELPRKPFTLGDVVSKAFRAYHGSRKISEPKPTLVLYRTMRHEMK